MQTNINELSDQGYTVQGGLIYAPADFSDVNVNDMRPMPSLTSTANNISLYHITDANEKAQHAKQWRKKIREIIQNHQDSIIQFIVKPLPADHSLKVARTLIQKYGRNTNITYDIHRPAPQYIKDFIIDLSGGSLAEINTFIASLEKARSEDQPIQRLMNIVRNLMDHMREIGYEMIRLDSALQNECNHLDIVVEKVNQLLAIEQPDLDGFQTMMENYIQKQFEKHPIEKLYWDYISTVQKYLTLRDILTPQRILGANEPLCCVCMTEVVIIAFSPCGHTFCTNCAKKAVTCYICRATVQNRIKIYYM